MTCKTLDDGLLRLGHRVRSIYPAFLMTQGILVYTAHDERFWRVIFAGDCYCTAGTAEWRNVDDGAGYFPDLSDDATKYCLFALAKKKWNRPISLCQADDGEGSIETWAIVHLSDDELHTFEVDGDSEEEVLVKLLEAWHSRQ